MIREILKGGHMKNQNNQYLKNSGNYINYQDYSSSSAIKMITSSSLPNSEATTANKNEIEYELVPIQVEYKELKDVMCKND